MYTYHIYIYTYITMIPVTVKLLGHGFSKAQPPADEVIGPSPNKVVFFFFSRPRDR